MLKLLLIFPFLMFPERSLIAATGDVYVEPVGLTDAAGALGAGLNLGALVTDTAYADGLQAAADGWGLHLDLFVTSDHAERRRLSDRLVAAGETLLIVQPVAGEDWAPVRKAAQERMLAFRFAQAAPYGAGTDAYKSGFEDMKSARASIATRLPKLQEVMPIACPVSPLPDSFFSPSGAPPALPVVRTDRQVATASAPAHGAVGSVMVAVVGSLLEQSSSGDPDRFLVDLEGGVASVRALPGAADSGRLSSVMTGWQIALRGPGGRDRDLVVENNGAEPSGFKPAVAALEELERALDGWKAQGIIDGYRRVGDDAYEVDHWHGATRVLRCGLFLSVAPGQEHTPRLVDSEPTSKQNAISFISSRGLVQRLAEVDSSGGVAAHLGDVLHAVASPPGGVAAYVLNLDGGALAVTPDRPLTPADLSAPVERVELDLRGPLASKQAVSVRLGGGVRRTFRRTILRAGALDEALAGLRESGWIAGWTTDGVRGGGLAANVVLERYLGRHRKFMSSLFVRRAGPPVAHPGLRWWVDSLQRLGFSLQSPDGWEQEFVEVPMRVVPAPRDVVFAPVAVPLP